VSLNARPARLVGLMLGWCWGRCRTFLEYGLFVPSGGPQLAAVLLSSRGGVLSTEAVRVATL